MFQTAVVTVAAEQTALTTVERAKMELAITTDDHDELLGHKIDEATSDIEAHAGRRFRRETLTETFWGTEGEAGALVLARAPVSSITSVTVDGTLYGSGQYRLAGEAGLLYRLDDSGYPVSWEWGKSIVVVYVAGYLLPDEEDRDLPAAIEAACLELVGSFWSSRGRDPAIMEEDVPGLGRVRYWVGSVGEEGQLPPSVMAKIKPWRRLVL